VLRTAVHLTRIVVRPRAGSTARIGHADGEAAALRRDPVGSGEGPEVRVERPVLLHDHHYVADAVDAAPMRHAYRVRHDAHLAGDARPATAREGYERDDRGGHTGAHGDDLETRC
jgi:hypothetical protein